MADDEAMRLLEEAVQAAGSARAWADAIGLSETYVSDVRCGRSDPGPAILAALGLVRVVSYVPAGEVRQ